MPSSVLDSLASAHRPNLKMGADADLRKKAIACPVIGKAIARAMRHAEIEPKQAAADMGYSDPAIVYRWFAGKESPNLDKLWSLGEKFQQGLVIALAHVCTTGVKVETTVTVSEQERTA